MQVELNVLNLQYDPPTNIVKILENSKEAIVPLLPPKVVNAIPHVVSDTSLHAQLINVSFRARVGEVTAILSTSLPERKSISDLVINRCQWGSFDGDVSLKGVAPDTSFDNNCAFVHRKVVFVPGLTYIQLLRYAARLRMKTFSFAEVEARVEVVLDLMNLQHCKHRRLVENPTTRGAQGGELRRLSIACEIVNLPPLLVFEDPTLTLEPAVALTIMQCLKALAGRGHVIVCTMPKPSPEIFGFIDNLVVVSRGYSIFSGPPQNIERFFCSPEVGYVKRSETHVVDFLLDISNGTERPTTQRTADLPHALQEKFENSRYFEHPVVSTNDGVLVVRGLPEKNYVDDFFNKTVGKRRNLTYMKWYFHRVYVTIERALYVKASDTELLKRVWFSSCFVGLVVGYLQFNCGNFGYYATTLLGFPYYGTANSTAVLFFMSAFTFAQQVLNCQYITQSLQVFRYEQFSGWCPTSGYMISVILADVPVMLIATFFFSSIVYFMTQMNKGIDNYIYFVCVLELNSFVGLVTAYLLATILKKEIPVRDTYLLISFLCICLSGFPFQLAHIRSYFSDLSQIVPMRWTFEALMNFKFLDNYEDGYNYLAQFSLSNFRHYQVFPIYGHFLAFSLVLTFLLMLPSPYFLFRKGAGGADKSGRSMSKDSDFGASDVSPSAPPKPEGGLQRPLLFDRETSVTGKSQLSISVSQTSVTGANSAPGGGQQGHGPTVTFHNLTYRVKDRLSPLGAKNILLNVSGQFDWGKLSMVLGASQSGRSSLLHILAGDVGFQSEVTGEILFDGAPVNAKLPLWERCAFVEAQDEQTRDISVYDTIYYAMKLRCSRWEFLRLIPENVQKTIDLLHLNDIVNKKAKNLTVGERRRLSIAEEIVAGPTLLMIDEPTTNLSTLDESVMMQCFREMVNQDRTVVAAMHHPSPQTFKLFDSLLLLSQGQVIYAGPCAEAVKYFTNLPTPYAMESFRHPADFLVDISGSFIANSTGEVMTPAVLASYCMDRRIMAVKSVPSIGVGTFSPMAEADDKDLEKLGSQGSSSLDLEAGATSPRVSVQILTAPAFVLPALATALVVGISDFFVGLAATNWQHTWIRIGVIVERSFFALWNRKKLLVGSLVLDVLIACFLGWILGKTDAQVYNLTSFFAISTLLLYFATIQKFYYLFTNHQVFLKEHSRGLYSTILYWLYSQWPMYFLRMVGAVIFAVISYALLALGFDQETEGFFVLITMCTVLGGHMVAEWICFSIQQIRDAYLTIPAWYFLFFVFSGLFLKPATLPRWVAPWAPSFSLIRWTMQSDFINYFYGDTAVLPVLPDINSYEQFLSLFGWGGKSKQYCLGMIVCNIAAYKFLSLLAAGYTSIAQKGGRKFKKSGGD